MPLPDMFFVVLIAAGYYYPVGRVYIRLGREGIPVRLRTTTWGPSIVTGLLAILIVLGAAINGVLLIMLAPFIHGPAWLLANPNIGTIAVLVVSLLLMLGLMLYGYVTRPRGDLTTLNFPF